MRTTILMTREDAKSWSQTYTNEYTAGEMEELFTARERADLEAGKQVVRTDRASTLTTVSLTALGLTALTK